MSINTSCRDRLTISLRTIATIGLLAMAAIPGANAATLDRVRETGHIRFGYFADGGLFTSAKDGTVEGYAASVCQRIADHVKGELGLSGLTVDWVPVEHEAALDAVSSGAIDALCTPTAVTIGRRKAVSYSIPVFPGGARAVLRSDAASALRSALAEAQPPKPVWRGSPAVKTLQNTRIAVVSGSATQNWAIGRAATLQIGAQIVPVPDYKTGLQQLLDRKVDVFFGERANVLGAMEASAFRDLTILDRMFTHELYGIALARDDEDFRLIVDRALSVLYAGGEIEGIYQKSFGPLSPAVRTFFQWNTLPL